MKSGHFPICCRRWSESILILIVLAAIAGGFIALLGQEETSILTMSILGMAVALYGYMLWTAWCIILYGACYTLMPKTNGPDAIIVHGARLINGEVTPLLASRLNKALDLYGRGGQPPIIILSGGQGDDESRPEADVMADYLIGKGVNPAHVVSEDQSMDTREKMENSTLILNRRDLKLARVLFVTSNYRVF